MTLKKNQEIIVMEINSSYFYEIIKKKNEIIFNDKAYFYVSKPITPYVRQFI